MTEVHGHHEQAGDIWYSYLTTARLPDYLPQPWYQMPVTRPIVRWLPADPRCRICHNPFRGVGGRIMRLFGVEPSRLNPDMCNLCERIAEEFPGGAEVETTLLFADVRGSTSLAEGMSAFEFSRLIDRFYQTAARTIFHHAGMVEKLIGDEVTGFFVPAFNGKKHAQAAVAAGKEILRATGHHEAGGPWIPVGVGIHTGPAYIGTVGQKGINLDIAVLGDNVNTAARLASAAPAGEIILSEASRAAAGLAQDGLEVRQLVLKGKQQPVDAWALRIDRPGP